MLNLFTLYTEIGFAFMLVSLLVLTINFTNCYYFTLYNNYKGHEQSQATLGDTCTHTSYLRTIKLKTRNHLAFLEICVALLNLIRNIVDIRVFKID